ncbi:hypothetical protein C1Y40_02088 [Mycobacterium talmoniae]|uniref:Uncharacterized protein n=1 Tax=Mycobacterium talmoniae TaxID=1858794 RepID=A0A2S8BLX8_9MYCO|nr:hypothetical protein C1Y40_02088 [Mycobacterium talmoniae]
MQPVIQGGDFHDTVGQPAQRHRQRRHVDAPVVRVGDDDHVGGQLVAVGGQQRTQRRRPGLLLPLHEHRHPHRRPAPVRPERRQMRCDTGLVVGAAALVEPAVAFGRLERRRGPLAGIALGLHIVVGVQQHGRRPGRGGIAGDHRRGAALGDDPNLRKAGLRQQIRDHLGAAMHLGSALRVGPHRFDADQTLQVAPHRRQHLPHPLHQISHGNEAR